MGREMKPKAVTAERPLGVGYTLTLRRDPKLVGDAPRNQAHPRQREIDPLNNLLVEELQELSRFKRTTLSIAEREIAAAGRAKRIAARRKLTHLIAATCIGARIARVAAQLRRRDEDSCAV